MPCLCTTFNNLSSTPAKSRDHKASPLRYMLEQVSMLPSNCFLLMNT